MKKLSSLLLAGALAASALMVSAGAVSFPAELQQGKTRSVELGDDVTFILQEDGSLWGWGSVDNGLLGNGGHYERSYTEESTGDVFHFQDTPQKVMEDVAQVDAGSAFTTLIRTDGSLWYTGADTNVFQKVDEDVSSACSWWTWSADDEAWYYNIYAVKQDGALWCYSLKCTEVYDANHERTGLKQVWLPAEKIMDRAAQISAGYEHLLVLKTDGSVWAWGNSSLGQLGNGQSGDLNAGFYPDREGVWQDTPVKVLDGAVDILADLDFSAAIKSDGSLWVWGETYYDSAALGLNYSGVGIEYSVRTRPTKLADQVKQVHHNASYTTILKTDGSVWVWGDPCMVLSGKLGKFAASPVNTGISGVKELAGCYDGIFYVKEDGSLWAHGNLMNWETLPGWKKLGTEHESSMPAWQEALVNPDFSYETQTLQITKPAASAATFADVPASAYYAGAVQWAVEQGITSGTTATTFSPGNTCTTAQILTFLWRANGSPAPAGDNPFSDVKDGAYYANAAVWAYEKGLVSGSAFSGSTPATRAATVTYLWKLAGSPKPQGTNPFSDVSGDAQAVVWAMEQGITAGTSATTFSPDNTCTRGQIVTFLYRYMAT